MQKQLRLREARQKMLNDVFDAATAAFQVGCESPSPFNREEALLRSATDPRHTGPARRCRSVAELLYIITVSECKYLVQV